jgi:hypothetical protein
VREEGLLKAKLPALQGVERGLYVHGKGGMSGLNREKESQPHPDLSAKVRGLSQNHQNKFMHASPQ